MQKVVKDWFAISSIVLDQLGRVGAFYHVARRDVTMCNAGLFKNHDSMEFSNLPLSDKGLFCLEHELLLKGRKKIKKQVDELTPDVRRHKRKLSSDYNPNNRYGYESFNKPAAST